MRTLEHSPQQCRGTSVMTVSLTKPGGPNGCVVDGSTPTQVLMISWTCLQANRLLAPFGVEFEPYTQESAACVAIVN